jgi:hypothetical protein
MVVKSGYVGGDVINLSIDDDPTTQESSFWIKAIMDVVS